ncbi:unnamed protein product [Closterium sp. Naga37s-1]|nr:unnamed protein product [Closterium sp. Naga37s-1]
MPIAFNAPPPPFLSTPSPPYSRLGANYLTGTLPAMALQLQVLAIASNLLAGAFPTQPFQLCDIRSNCLSSPGSCTNDAGVAQRATGCAFCGSATGTPPFCAGTTCTPDVAALLTAGTVNSPNGTLAAMFCEAVPVDDNSALALLALRAGLGVSALSWAVDSPCTIAGNAPAVDSWTGVVCDLSSQVYVCAMLFAMCVEPRSNVASNLLDARMSEWALPLTGLKALKLLSLNYNWFSGPLPSYLLTMSSLSALNVQFNYLAGPITGTPSASLKSLNVASNLLTGTFPATSTTACDARSNCLADSSKCLASASSTQRLAAACTLCGAGSSGAVICNGGVCAPDTTEPVAAFTPNSASDAMLPMQCSGVRIDATAVSVLGSLKVALGVPLTDWGVNSQCTAVGVSISVPGPGDLGGVLCNAAGSVVEINLNTRNLAGSMHGDISKLTALTTLPICGAWIPISPLSSPRPSPHPTVIALQCQGANPQSFMVYPFLSPPFPGFPCSPLPLFLTSPFPALPRPILPCLLSYAPLSLPPRVFHTNFLAGRLDAFTAPFTSLTKLENLPSTPSDSPPPSPFPPPLPCVLCSHLHYNYLFGPIPSALIGLKGLFKLSLGSNYLTRSVPVPSATLKQLDLENNYLVGAFLTGSFQLCSARTNCFSSAAACTANAGKGTVQRATCSICGSADGTGVLCGSGGASTCQPTAASLASLSTLNSPTTPALPMACSLLPAVPVNSTAMAALLGIKAALGVTHTGWAAGAVCTLAGTAGTVASGSLTGVECDSAGNPVKITLNTQQLFGVLPADVTKLTALTYLNLQSNLFRARLEDFALRLPTLTNLAVLLLDYNWFKGSLPPPLLAMTKLTRLSMAYNYLTYRVPPVSASLKAIDLSNNFLSGNFPANSATSCVSAANCFAGAAACNTASEQSGTAQRASGCDICGTAAGQGMLCGGTGVCTPNAAALFTAKTVNAAAAAVLPMACVDLVCDAAATVACPLDWRCQGLNDLSYNLFSGQLSKFVSNMAPLTTMAILTLNSNYLFDSIPSALVNMPKLTELRLGANYLTGTLPAMATQLQVLAIASNLLAGAFPTQPFQLHPAFLCGHHLLSRMPPSQRCRPFQWMITPLGLMPSVFFSLKPRSVLYPPNPDLPRFEIFALYTHAPAGAAGTEGGAGRECEQLGGGLALHSRWQRPRSGQLDGHRLRPLESSPSEVPLPPSMLCEASEVPLPPSLLCGASEVPLPPSVLCGASEVPLPPSVLSAAAPSYDHYWSRHRSAPPALPQSPLPHPRTPLPGGSPRVHPSATGASLRLLRGCSGRERQGKRAHGGTIGSCRERERVAERELGAGCSERARTRTEWGGKSRGNAREGIRAREWRRKRATG